LSITLPTIHASFSFVMCSHFEPFFHSETLARLPQYWRVNSGFVIASHVFLGVERINNVYTCFGCFIRSSFRVVFLVFVLLEIAFQIAQRLQAKALILANPTL